MFSYSVVLKAILYLGMIIALTDLIIFDVYQGKGIPEDKKSIAYTLRWQSKKRTLVDGEVDEAVENIVHFLNKKIKAEIRE